MSSICLIKNGKWLKKTSETERESEARGIRSLAGIRQENYFTSIIILLTQEHAVGGKCFFAPKHNDDHYIFNIY